MRRMSWLACFWTLSILVGARARAENTAADEKTVYKGHICDADEYKRLVTNKNRTLQIEGGFWMYDTNGHAILNDAGYFKNFDTVPAANVGDTVNMSLDIGVIGTATPYKLNTKSFPAPVPILHLMKDGKEYKQIKFDLGAC